MPIFIVLFLNQNRKQSEMIPPFSATKMTSYEDIRHVAYQPLSAVMELYLHSAKVGKLGMVATLENQLICCCVKAVSANATEM